MSDTTDPLMKSSPGKTSENDRLENVEADMGALYALLETRVFAIAEELRRAQARDEWMSAQLRETRRTLRDQGQVLDEIRTVLVRETKGFF
jgi:hypothetical protein